MSSFSKILSVQKLYHPHELSSMAANPRESASSVRVSGTPAELRGRAESRTMKTGKLHDYTTVKELFIKHRKHILTSKRQCKAYIKVRGKTIWDRIRGEKAEVNEVECSYMKRL